MSNPYIDSLRAKFTALNESITGLQTRATSEKRDLTTEELKSVTDQGAAAKALGEQIESLVDIETRASKVAALSVTVTDPAKSAEQQLVEQNRSLTLGGTARQTSNTTAVDRDPGHYTRSSQNSFFADIVHARDGDERSSQRLQEHNRAGLTTQANGPGVVPPHWLTEEFELIARQGRRLANVVRNIPLGSDPRPITLPKQIAGTDAVVLEQLNENDPVAATDLYDTDVDTVTMKPTAGIQVVSRQMLDMSSPAVDMLIYGDMISAYNQKVEAKVGAALILAAGTALPILASEAAVTSSIALDAVVDIAIRVRNLRKLPADVLAMGVVRYGQFLKYKDGTGRPLIVGADRGPMNVPGIGTVEVDGNIEGLGVIASDGISAGAGLVYPDSVLAFRAADQILFESDVLQFRYEQPLGPQSVKLGIWGYTGFISRQAGKSVQRFQITNV